MTLKLNLHAGKSNAQPVCGGVIASLSDRPAETSGIAGSPTGSALWRGMDVQKIADFEVYKPVWRDAFSLAKSVLAVSPILKVSFRPCVYARPNGLNRPQIAELSAGGRRKVYRSHGHQPVWSLLVPHVVSKVPSLEVA